MKSLLARRNRGIWCSRQSISAINPGEQADLVVDVACNHEFNTCWLMSVVMASCAKQTPSSCWRTPAARTESRPRRRGAREGE